MSVHYTGPQSLGEHTYDGIIYSNLFPASSLDRIKKLELVEGDVVVSTYPKSGTTWMMNAVRMIDEDDKSGKKMHAGINGKGNLFMEMQFPGFPPAMDTVEKLEGPRLLMTHMEPRFFKEGLELKKAKFIIVIRNEKDALVSFYHWNKKIAFLGYTGDWNDYFEDYMKDYLGYRNWVEWNLDWYQFKDHENILFLKFEDMKEDLPRELEKIAKFLGKEINNMDKICHELSFEKLKEKEVLHLRKGDTGGWKEYFSEEQSAILDKRYNERVLPEGLVMRFEL